MTAQLVRRAQLDDWVSDLIANHEVFGAVDGELQQLQAPPSWAPQPPTRTPPTRLLMPAEEPIFVFGPGGDGTVINEVITAPERLLLGVRPCDLRAIFLLDRVMAAGVPDRHYLARRQALSLIGWSCSQPCDARCFCQAVGALDHCQGADVMLTAVDDQVLVEALTPRGLQLVAGLDAPEVQAEPLLERARGARPQPFGRPLDLPEPSRFQAAWSDDLWQRHAERCLSCGSCNLVCPTCYCFDVRDELAISVHCAGCRSRSPDSCMLPHFAVVAGGHDFRPTAAARQRHRVSRKFAYQPKRMGDGPHCVGCGRCGRSCTADIDIYDIVRELP